MAVNLEYAVYKDGRMIHITDAKNGIACNCRCPNPLCNQKLIAKNNPSNDNSPHFAHTSGTQCIGAKESELHELSKQIICDNSQIILPDSSIFLYQIGKSEVVIDKYRADIELIGGNYPLFVEIEVSNPVSITKEFGLRRSNNKTLIIDLTDIPRDINIGDLNVLLLNEINNKRLILPDIKSELINSKNDSWFGYVIIAFLFALYFVPKLFKNLTKKNKKHR